jgi:hypothetical protein
VQRLSGGVFLGEVEADVRLRSEGLEGNVHETNQVKPAGISRQAFELISWRRIVLKPH